LETIAYLSYDGLTDPLGQSQVLPYVKGLAQKGYAITIFSFEKKKRFNSNKNIIEEICREAGIKWLPFLYTKNPPVFSTIWDVSRLYKAVKKQHRKKHFDLIHCRSYLSALVGLRMKRNFGVPFIFDMRGFWADERVDGKLWKLNNPVFRTIYRYFKKKEKEFLINSAYTISLTENAKQEIQSWKLPHSIAPIQVIPCCVDLDLFDPQKIRQEDVNTLREQSNIPSGATVISYIGSTGTWYMLDEMFAFFRKWLDKKPGSILFFITTDDQQYLEHAAAKHHIPASALRVRSAARKEVPLYISISDLSLFFIKPVFSKKASSPTKQGEIMAMGKPAICNNGVGDTGWVIEKYHSGILINDLSDNAYESAIQIADRKAFDASSIRKGAEDFFSLKEGIRRYTEVYDKILHAKSS